MFRDSQVAEIAIKSLEDGTTVRVLEFVGLKGSDDPRLAETLFFAQQAGMSAKIVEIALAESTFQLEPGALYFTVGKVELRTGTNGGVLRAIARAALTSESFFVNKVSGTGRVYLEPTFGHFLLHDIRSEENAVIVDRGAFYAGSGNLAISAATVPSVSGAVLGNEGLFQTRISGRGLAVIVSPVPESELVRVKLDNEELRVDGNFALMRSAGISFSVEKSSKSWIGSAFSGEGFLNVYRGKGSVWLAPTQGIYQRLAKDGFTSLSGGAKSRDTRVEN